MLATALLSWYNVNENKKIHSFIEDVQGKEAHNADEDRCYELFL